MKSLTFMFVSALAFLPAVAMAQTPSPSPAAGAAVKAMHAHEMQPHQIGASEGMKNEKCHVVGSWAKCGFSDSGENSYTTVIMQEKSGAWSYVWQYGGVAPADYLVKHGVPAAIATKFADPQF
jgi:hypothetical protein